MWPSLRLDEDHEEQQEQKMADGEQALELEVKKAEEMSKATPNKEEGPQTRRPKTEQEKTDQAAKVAQ